MILHATSPEVLSNKATHTVTALRRKVRGQVDQRFQQEVHHRNRALAWGAGPARSLYFRTVVVGGVILFFLTLFGHANFSKNGVLKQA